MQRFSKRFMVAAVLFLTSLLMSCVHAETPPTATAKATFAVRWYDVGVAALAGRPGIYKVETGWSGFREVDRVYYDPAKVSIAEMENLLKESGTYLETLSVEQLKVRGLEKQE